MEIRTPNKNEIAKTLGPQYRAMQKAGSGTVQVQLNNLSDIWESEQLIALVEGRQKLIDAGYDPGQIIVSHRYKKDDGTFDTFPRLWVNDEVRERNTSRSSGITEAKVTEIVQKTVNEGLADIRAMLQNLQAPAPTEAPVDDEGDGTDEVPEKTEDAPF